MFGASETPQTWERRVNAAVPHIRSSSSGPWRLFLGPRASSWRSSMPSDSRIFVLVRGKSIYIYIWIYTTNCKRLLTWILCTLSKRTVFYILHVRVGFLYEDDASLCKHFPCKLWTVQYSALCFWPCCLANPFSQRMSGRKYQWTLALLVYSFSHVMNVHVAVTRSAYEYSCCLCLQ